MAIEELPPLFAPGQRLGRYQLTQRLAVGGMAEVYLAVASGAGDFRKIVAIKRLLPQHALDPQLLRMFLDEARLMARLSHPNVAQVSDVGEGSGVEVPYFVMEYIHGTDLRGVLNAAGGPLPIEHALAIASAVAAGLHHAHEHRGENGQPLEIVHRDVSPSNVLISFNGGVRVTDFGVAKWAEQRSFTHSGQLKGKFAHMSPEQCRGEALDRRSDVFALGTLLYEMITGRPPFVAENAYELLTQIVSQDAAAPVRPGGDVPAQLAFIIMRSLRRAREDRYPTAQALQLDLEAFAREHKLVVSPVALAGYLDSLFGARVTEWRQALEGGLTLADQLGKQSATTGTRANAGTTATGTASTTASTTASPTASPADRTATDTSSLGAPLRALTLRRNPESQARGITQKRALAGAVAGVLVISATATTLVIRHGQPANQAPAQATAAATATATATVTATTSAAPTVASRASPADTFPSPRPPRTSTPESASESRPPSRLFRASRRARDLSNVGGASETSSDAEPGPQMAPAPTPGLPVPPIPPSPVTTPAQFAPAVPLAAPAAPPPRAVPAPLKVWDPDSPVPP